MQRRMGRKSNRSIFPSLSADPINEAIDQLLVESIATLAHQVVDSRECFLGILGHDLRTPLCSSTLLAYLLAESTTLDSRSLQMSVNLRSSLGCDGPPRPGPPRLHRCPAGCQAGSPSRNHGPAAALPRGACRNAYHPLDRTFVFSASQGEISGEWDAGRLRQPLTYLIENTVQHGPLKNQHSIVIIRHCFSSPSIIRRLHRPITGSACDGSPLPRT